MNLGLVASWKTVTLTAIANGVNGCATAAGCWQINGALGAAKAAALTQDINLLYTMPANWMVHGYRVKPLAACTGTTTAVTYFGTTVRPTDFLNAGYDIQAAPADSNIESGAPHAEATSTIAATWNARITTTVQNVDQLVAGCSVRYSGFVSVVPTD